MSIKSSFEFVSKKVLPLFILALLLPMSLQAQEGEFEPDFFPADAPVTEGVEIASINLSNAAILSQTPESLVLEFMLENQGQEPQFDIKYGVELIKDLPNGAQEVADSFVGRETLTVSAGQSVSKVVNYPITAVAPGTYSVWITARTTGGTLLGLGSAGVVTVAMSDVVEIRVDTCYLTIEGEDARYNLGQGVDVSSAEDLTLNCLIKNHGLTTRQVQPQFETYFRTVFGEKIQLEYEPIAAFTIAAGAEQELRLTIPKATDPQAYDAVLTLLDTTTRSIVSSRATIHYVIQGASATIQTVNFSKNAYTAGENIELSFAWTGSADGFIDSRLSAESVLEGSEVEGENIEGTDIGGVVSAVIQVVDGEGMACAPQSTQALTDSLMTLSVVAITDCADPAATVTLLAPDGSILDTRNIVSPSLEAKAEPVAGDPSEGNALMYVTIIGLIGAVTIILLAVTRHRREHIVAE